MQKGYTAEFTLSIDSELIATKSKIRVGTEKGSPEANAIRIFGGFWKRK